jgi:putative CocE/NonD family hydrolase
MRGVSFSITVLLIGCLLAVRAFQGNSTVGSSKPEYKVQIEFDQRVKMRDEVELSADIYRPAASGRFPAILVRTPYNKGSDSKSQLFLTQGRYFASRGYVYVAMDVRGRGDSDGKFIPWRNEGVDGYDAIEWCAKQPWSTGKIGTIGGSYTGYDQWAAAVHQPPHLAAMVVLTSPPDHFVEYPTGLDSPTSIAWYHLIRGHVLQSMAAVDWDSVFLHLPIYTMDEAAGFRAQY